MQTLKIKFLDDKAKVPTKAYYSDAGADIHCTGITFGTNQVTYHTGLSFSIPKGFYIELVPRSSISKTDLRLSNSLGIVDSDFRGEVVFKFDVINEGKNIYAVGDRIGQMILHKIEEYNFQLVDKLDITDRGIGSFGSTGQ